jgi:predicted protein tyrosine phosphatase
VQKILFICSQNKLRSPTAEQVFSEMPGLDVLSSGTNNDAVTALTSGLVEWADKIFVMENTHRQKLQKRFRSSLNGKKILCLGIPDDFSYMDPKLVAILKKKVPQFL